MSEDESLGSKDINDQIKETVTAVIKIREGERALRKIP